MAIYGVSILLQGGLGGLPPPPGIPLRINVNLSTCHPVDMSPVTWLYMEFSFCCGGLGGLPHQAFRCESMPTPLNLTYILPYDCPCFARIRNFFTSVDVSTVCRPVDLQPVTCNMAIYGVCILFRGSVGLAPKHSVVNQCLIH